MNIYKYQVIDPFGRYGWESKSFPTQRELFAYLVANKQEIFDQKKSVMKRAEGSLSTMLPEKIDESVSKAKPLYENNKEAGILKRTIVANTYWWMDSHSDVHLGRGPEGDTAIFTETIKNRANKIFPTDQHNWSLDGKMGKTLNLYEAPISWRALGVGRTGMTEALFADAQIEKSKNEARYNDYLNDEIDQHSVGMRYQDIQLAVNDEEEFPKEFQIYNKYIGRIGNRGEVEKQGFFFAVGKAYLAEYSAVIAGSNELTPTLGQSSGETDKGLSRDNRLVDGVEKLMFNLKLKSLCQ